MVAKAAAVSKNRVICSRAAAAKVSPWPARASGPPIWRLSATLAVGKTPWACRMGSARATPATMPAWPRLASWVAGSAESRLTQKLRTGVAARFSASRVTLSVKIQSVWVGELIAVGAGTQVCDARLARMAEQVGRSGQEGLAAGEGQRLDAEGRATVDDAPGRIRDHVAARAASVTFMPH